jgi:UDP-N-acetylglucosamine diphosphorylase/glucosamine-1-phosphate N-acetyltransferase
MTRLLVLAEGAAAGGFEPLDLTRPGFMMRDGAYVNAERWIELLRPDLVAAYVRPELAATVAERTGWGVNQIPSQIPADVWIVGGMVQPIDDARWRALKFPPRFRWESGNGIVERMPSAQEKNLHDVMASLLKPVPRSGQRESSVIDFPGRVPAGVWDLVANLNSQLAFDWKLWTRHHKSPARGKLHAPAKGVFVDGDSSLVWRGKNVRVDPQVVINTRGGPVWLDEGVHVEPFTRIDGPAYIGHGTSLLGGKFTGGAAIGPGCKIGGEWEASIAQGFVNKAHAGFFGHGILGEWVNLGAMTTNSDLKNTYGTVRVDRAGASIETGLAKVGSFIADHSKTGIGTLISTGASWGVAVNYFGGNLGPKTLPSFVWGGGGRLTEHQLERMLATAETAMGRRAEILKSLGFPVGLTQPQRELLTGLFRESASARTAFLSKQP